MSKTEWAELHALCWEVSGACDGALAVRARGLGRKYGRRAQAGRTTGWKPVPLLKPKPNENQNHE